MLPPLAVTLGKPHPCPSLGKPLEVYCLFSGHTPCSVPN